jgi:predicted permease
MTGPGRDLRFGVRLILTERGAASWAIVTLAVGIGAIASIFSAVDTVLLRPLPYASPDRLVLIEQRLPALSTSSLSPVAAAEFGDYRDRSRSFSHMAAYEIWPMILTGAGDSELLRVGRVSAALFPLLGVQPLLGRSFAPAEDAAGRNGVAIVGYELWQRRFDGSASALGRAVVLEARPFQIVGVMPRGFRFPHPGMPGARYVDLWIPFALTADDLAGRGRTFGTRVIGRLAPGIALPEASADVEAVAASFQRDHPASYMRMPVVPVVTRLDRRVVGDVRPLLLMLAGAGALVLLMACANVSSLMLARIAARRRELTVCLALGASRWRIARQLLSECVALTTVAGAAGFAVAAGAVSVIRRFGPPDLPRLDEVALDARLVLFTLAASALAAFACGLAPACSATRADLMHLLRDGTSSSGRGRRSLASSIVVFETAAGLVVLVAVGLLARSFARVLDVDPGFRAEGVAAVRTALPERTYPAPEARNGVSREILARLDRIPGTRAAATSNLPLEAQWNIGLSIEGGDPDRTSLVTTAAVSPGYFTTLGIPLRSGRDFTHGDDMEAPGVVIVSASLAERLWPGADPLGKRVQFGRRRPDQPWLTVVGVAGDVRAAGLDREPRPIVYQALFWLDGLSTPTFIVRGDGDTSARLADIRRAIWSVDRGLPAHDAVTMTEMVGDSLRRRQFSLLLMLALSASALVLSAIGLFGVMSHDVARRTREVGVRMAVGAGPTDIARLMLKDGLSLAGLGITVGLTAAVPAQRLIAGMLFGVEPHDPMTFTVVAALLLGVLLAAAWGPARRATRVDPAIALRAE